MRLFNSPTGYGAVAQVLHWVTVVFVILAWTLGIFGDLLPRGDLVTPASSFISWLGYQLLFSS